MFGSVESMNMSTGFERRLADFDPLKLMDCRPTTRSRVRSSAMEKDTVFSLKRDRS